MLSLIHYISESQPIVQRLIGIVRCNVERVSISPVYAAVMGRTLNILPIYKYCVQLNRPMFKT